MNFARNIVVSLLVLGFAVSFASARENLRVLYVFDTNSKNYTYSERKNISKRLNNQLNASFSNSGLSSTISFSKVKFEKAAVIPSYKSLYFAKRTYQIDTNKNLVLRKLQKKHKADVVVAVMEKPNDSDCGQSVNIPWNYIGFADPNNSFVFINSASKCNYSYLLAHEVGHTFGLHHGKYTANYYNDNSHFYKNGYNNGFGVKYRYGVDYGTLMARGVVRRFNRFSNPKVKKCGSNYYFNWNACGDSNANAVKFIKKWAKYYNRRGG